MTSSNDIIHLEAEILTRKKYHAIDPALVRRVGSEELSRQKSYKEALQSTRSRLHQAACAYQSPELDYASAARELADLPRSLESAQTKEFCHRLMNAHASSRERLHILDKFYQRIAQETEGVHTILDCACGLNPLALPWMPWSGITRFDACDVFSDLTAFLQLFLDHYNIHGHVTTFDLTADTPGGAYDLVLLLKTLPCLEQLEKYSARRLITTLNSRYLLISYPVASLGGHQKGMSRNYTAQFEELTADWKGKIKRIEFETELAFLLIRDPFEV
jgi:16S rRNA (guanine(1405)-N(7))-methyltransferase